MYLFAKLLKSRCSRPRGREKESMDVSLVDVGKKRGDAEQRVHDVVSCRPRVHNFIFFIFLLVLSFFYKRNCRGEKERACQ